MSREPIFNYDISNRRIPFESQPFVAFGDLSVAGDQYARAGSLESCPDTVAISESISEDRFDTGDSIYHANCHRCFGDVEFENKNGLIGIERNI
jgi:hypothetical protein